MAEEKQKNAPVSFWHLAGKWLFVDDNIIPVLLLITIVAALVLVAFVAVMSSSGYNSRQVTDACKVIVENTQKCAALLAYLAG